MFDNNYIEQLSADLLARLPELEWKIATLNHAVFYQGIPKKLFRSLDISPAQCIDEVKKDIHYLAKQKPSLSAHYLAEQIQKKIDVLVGAYKVQQKNCHNASKSPAFSMSMLSTRHQWLHTLEQDIVLLTQQQHALAKTLAQRKNTHADPAFILSVQAELGKIEQQLTLAQEQFDKAIL